MQDLTFMMGNFAAELPGDLRYATTNHMWCRAADGHLRFGFTAYAVRLMQDVYFLDWVVNPGDTVTQLQQIGHIETSKAVADLFAPVGGTIVAFNQELLKDPSGINVDKYGAGWLFEMAGDAGICKDVQEYHQFLADNWEKTQRLIKGKINTED
ncbi:MAG: glycine cleavage system protein H [Gemmataceae bacterium]|nr:glycine cleavage system protein H [Gemmataceae bacterium]